MAQLKLETKRLFIIPLTYEQLSIYIQPDHSLENHLHLNLGSREVSEKLINSITNKILPLLKYPCKNYFFYTFWTIILKDKNVIVGDICFKGPPNENGEIEIGYETYKDYRESGIMTETVEAITNWAFQQPLVKSILAETDPNNIPSQKTLEKNHFINYKQTENDIFWKLEKLY